MKLLKYKSYVGSAEVSTEDAVLHGKLMYIRDLVTYESRDVTSLQASFESAVDDYIADCEEEGRAPDVPYKGSFNVRVSPNLHRELGEAARISGCSLNEYVGKTLSCHNVVAAPKPDVAYANWTKLLTLAHGGSDRSGAVLAYPRPELNDPKASTVKSRFDSWTVTKPIMQ